MPLLRLRTDLVALAATGLTATAVLAQSTNYASFEATSEKPVQLGYYASAHKNCTPGALPTIRVIEAPKSGILTVRKGVLSTNKVAGCPGLKTPAQIALLSGSCRLRRPRPRQLRGDRREWRRLVLRDGHHS